MPNQNIYMISVSTSTMYLFMYKFVKNFTLTDCLNYLCLRNLSHYKLIIYVCPFLLICFFTNIIQILEKCQLNLLFIYRTFLIFNICVYLHVERIIFFWLRFFFGKVLFLLWFLCNKASNPQPFGQSEKIIQISFRNLTKVCKYYNFFVSLKLLCDLFVLI